MTREQLKILSTLPAVIDALNAFAAESEALRVAAARAGFGGPPPSLPNPNTEARRTNSPANMGLFPPGPVNPPTPERAEFRAGNPPASEEDAVGFDPNAPAHLADARAKRAEFLRQVKQGDPHRASKLAQFRHDEGETQDDVVTTSTLNLGGNNG